MRVNSFIFCMYIHIYLHFSIHHYKTGRFHESSPLFHQSNASNLLLASRLIQSIGSKVLSSAFSVSDDCMRANAARPK